METVLAAFAVEAPWSGALYGVEVTTECHPGDEFTK
jgi:hypothetical protein